MPTFAKLALCRSALLASAISLAAAGAAAGVITLPPDSSKLRPSTLPRYPLAQQKCGMCHAADHISHHPPGLDPVHWTAEMGKMQHSYGAPLNRDEIALIGAYLAVTYGSAKASDTSVTPLTATWEAAKTARDSKSAGGSDATDVHALLTANACLSCRAPQKAVAGPAFSAVAARYRGEATAPARRTNSIRQGGVDEWGQVAMPPMAHLGDDQIRALAAFVLKQ